MSRIPTPAAVADAPESLRPVLEAVVRQLARAPGMFRLIAVSAETPEGHLDLFGAFGRVTLLAATRERIALAIAEVNGCSYCVPAQTCLGRNVDRRDDDEIAANRNSASNDSRADAAVGFATTVARERGRVTDADFAAVKRAGYTDAQIAEIVAHTGTTYFNDVFQTQNDVPVVQARRAA
jgi:uncharacterized peroxidase-related enzyme